MAELQKAAGLNIALVESLVKKHFGSEFTSKLAWSVLKGRYVPSDLPRRLGAPQRLFGIRLWWKTIGEFSDNIGFRLELWRPEYLRQAEALVADYTAQARETKLELYPAFMPLPAEGRQTTAQGVGRPPGR
jgi:hypothetical protein